MPPLLDPRRPLRRLDVAVSVAASVAALGAACAGNKAATASGAGAQGGTTAARGDRNVITQDQMVQQHFKNAYDAVQTLHPNWMATRGTDSFNSPSQVIVYLDDSRLGGVDQLQTIPPSSVKTIRHFNGVDASARWGLDHGAGVIQVLSRVR